MGFYPKISIVIPVYNGSDFMHEAIDSALDQTYQNIEVLVINDGSTDNGETERIAHSYGDRIRYFAKPNGGVASALNLAIQEMSGDFFSWLSHDDLYLKSKVEREVAFLSGLNRDRTIIYSDYSIFSSDPKMAVPVHLKGVPPEQFRYWITIENCLHGCTLLVPKTAFDECGYFNETLQTTQDYDLWFRMAEKYRFVHIPEVLVKARSHSEQGSIKMADTALKEINTLLSRFVSDLSANELTSATKHLPSLAYAGIAASMWSRGFHNAGKSAARFSLKHMKRSSLLDNISAFRTMMGGALKYHTVRLSRTFLTPVLRLKIKKLMQRIKEGGPEDRIEWQAFGMKKKFSQIYDKNIFGGRISRSGEGADLVQTAVIRDELPRLVQKLGVNTFLDAPCGDWYWMKEIELGVNRYTGIDIVEALIQKNQREFGNAATSFQCMNLAEDELPQSDLIFCRDCLVHLSFKDGLQIIANFKRSRSKYLLTTTFDKRDRNNDLIGKDGFWRPLNLQLPPFNFPSPLLLINEGCTEEAGQYTDKNLGLWLLRDIASG